MKRRKGNRKDKIADKTWSYKVNGKYKGVQAKGERKS